jgi:hypothetical protein
MKQRSQSDVEDSESYAVFGPFHGKLLVDQGDKETIAKDNSNGWRVDVESSQARRSTSINNQSSIKLRELNCRVRDVMSYKRFQSNSNSIASQRNESGEIKSSRIGMEHQADVESMESWISKSAGQDAASAIVVKEDLLWSAEQLSESKDSVDEWLSTVHQQVLEHAICLGAIIIVQSYDKDANKSQRSQSWKVACVTSIAAGSAAIEAVDNGDKITVFDGKQVSCGYINVLMF